MKEDINNSLKVISILLFASLAAAIILISRYPVTGFELCIFSAIPPLAWILLIAPIIGGIGIIVHQINKDKEGGIWWIGLFLILLSNIVIIMLQYIRGYAISGWAGDQLSHLGKVIDIIEIGDFTGNIYPVTHTLIAQVSLIVDISPTVLMRLIPPLFYLLFVLFAYLVSIQILPKPAAILATTASTVLFCYYYIEVFPLGFSFILFPLIMYIYFKHLKAKSVSSGILLIVIVIMAVFFHPVSSFALALGLIVMALLKPLLDKISIEKTGYNGSLLYSISQASLIIPAISIIILLMWLWENFWVWNHAVMSVVSWFELELLVKPMTDHAAIAFDKLGLGFLDILELFIRMFGHVFIYLFLSIFAILILIKKKVTSPASIVNSTLLYSSFFLLATGVWLTDIVRPLTGLSAGRNVFLVIALFPLLVGVALYTISGIRENARYRDGMLGGKGINKTVKVMRVASIVLILSVCSLIGIFSIYPSPLTLRPSNGITHAEVAGQNWILEQRCYDVRIIGMGVPTPIRFAHASRGIRGVGEVRNLPSIGSVDWTVPDHFNYTQYSTLGESFTEDRYMMLREEFLIRIYTELWPQVGRFEQNDFVMLRNDPSVNQLYSSGGMEIWFVNGNRI